MKKRGRVNILLVLAIVCGVAISAIAAGEFKYESRGKRDPFVSLIETGRSAGSGLEGISSVKDVTLEGIAFAPGGKRIAVLNGELVKENDKFGEIEIRKITKNSVTLLIAGTEQTLTLAEEGGIKGGK